MMTMRAASANTRRVLLVEDEIEIANMLAIYFSGQQGLVLFHAPDGETALIRAAAAMPDVILMDITLPDIDGYEVCRRLRQQPRTAHIPVIFLTRRSGRNDRLTGLELGADDFIAKPFNLQELLLRTRNSIQRAGREAEIDPKTGLPSARVLRSVIDAARVDPDKAVIELSVENALPFGTAYGLVASAELNVYLAKLIQEAVQALGHPENSIGYVGDLEYVIVCEQSAAKAIAERIKHRFDANATHHYRRADIQEGQFVFQGERHPLLMVSFRVLSGERDHAW